MKRSKMLILAVAVALVVLIGVRLDDRAVAYDVTDAPDAPEFTHSAAQDWINSPPLTLEALRGRVVLIDFWTFDCWNCYRSFPWLHSLEERFTEQGLSVVGVHSPEFKHERERANVVKKVAEFKLSHPVMLDNDRA